MANLHGLSHCLFLKRLRRLTRLIAKKLTGGSDMASSWADRRGGGHESLVHVQEAQIVVFRSRVVLASPFSADVDMFSGGYSQILLPPEPQMLF